MKREYVQERNTYGGGTEIRVSNSSYPTIEARIAEQIATRFALIAGMPDGEDSAGRQKLRLPTATELAQRSCDIAAALASEFETRDWLIDLPEPRLGKTEVFREDISQGALTAEE